MANDFGKGAWGFSISVLGAEAGGMGGTGVGISVGSTKTLSSRLLPEASWLSKFLHFSMMKVTTALLQRFFFSTANLFLVSLEKELNR